MVDTYRTLFLCVEHNDLDQLCVHNDTKVTIPASNEIHFAKKLVIDLAFPVVSHPGNSENIISEFD